mgnify:CR=1 FL=1
MNKHTRGPVHRLNIRESMRLAELLEKEFVTKRVSDDEFAKYVEELLGFKITDGNVRGLREALDIPSLNAIFKGSKIITAEERILRVEADLADLKKRFEKLLEQLGGPTL